MIWGLTTQKKDKMNGMNHKSWKEDMVIRAWDTFDEYTKKYLLTEKKSYYAMKILKKHKII